MKRINKTYKLAFALAMASTAPIIGYSLYDSMVKTRSAMEARILSCEQFSLVCALCLQRDDHSILRKTASDLLERDSSLAGIKIDRADGFQVCSLGDLSDFDQEDSKGSSDDRIISAKLFRLQKPWGTVGFYYRSSPNQSNSNQVFATTLIAILFNLLVFSIILRRSLSVLDTTKVVPTRVRNTLNTIPDGVVIIDAEGRIIVANEAFQKSTGMAVEELIGSGLDRIPFAPLDSSLPWIDAEKSSKTKNGVKAFLSMPEGDRFFMVGCSPIFDAQERHAGNLVSFQDITELENHKQKIECTLSELSESKEQLRQQNEKLHELASKDMLTGVFNRRYLFEHLENYWESAVDQCHSLSVVMLDVDHFKKLNDGYGHSVGDQVLRDVAAVIRANAPEFSVVGRYGGEEFCVVLPNMDASRAGQAAEKIRHSIQTQLEHPYRVTASIGVASNLPEIGTYQIMLDRADKALYSAKRSGRNAVHCWSPSLENGEPSKPSSRSAPGRLTKAAQPSPSSSSSVNPDADLSNMVKELKEISLSPQTRKSETPANIR
jgi:diguanylate cyclase (GGDEF)-like protein/PAS domain S-box-containing protein